MPLPKRLIVPLRCHCKTAATTTTNYRYPSVHALQPQARRALSGKNNCTLLPLRRIACLWLVSTPLFGTTTTTRSFWTRIFGNIAVSVSATLESQQHSCSRHWDRWNRLKKTTYSHTTKRSSGISSAFVLGKSPRRISPADGWSIQSNHYTQSRRFMTSFVTRRQQDGTITVSPKKEEDQSALVVIAHGLGDTAEGFADVAEVRYSSLPLALS
jgi:hypothetical protein